MQVFVSVCVESSGVVWKDVGGQVTIQCKSSEPEQEYLTLKKGLNEEFQVLYKDKNSGKNTIAAQFTGRLQLNGVMPNVDIFITNLTSNDTGPYWCVYKRFDPASHDTKIMKGTGSVLLVVTGEPHQFMYYLTKYLVLTIQLHLSSTGGKKSFMTKRQSIKYRQERHDSIV